MAPTAETKSESVSGFKSLPANKQYENEDADADEAEDEDENEDEDDISRE